MNLNDSKLNPLAKEFTPICVENKRNKQFNIRSRESSQRESVKEHRQLVKTDDQFHTHDRFRKVKADKFPNNRPLSREHVKYDEELVRPRFQRKRRPNNRKRLIRENEQSHYVIKNQSTMTHSEVVEKKDEILFSSNDFPELPTVPLVIQNTPTTIDKDTSETIEIVSKNKSDQLKVNIVKRNDSAAEKLRSYWIEKAIEVANRINTPSSPSETKISVQDGEYCLIVSSRCHNVKCEDCDPFLFESSSNVSNSYRRMMNKSEDWQPIESEIVNWFIAVFRNDFRTIQKFLQTNKAIARVFCELRFDTKSIKDETKISFIQIYELNSQNRQQYWPNVESPTSNHEFSKYYDIFNGLTSVHICAFLNYEASLSMILLHIGSDHTLINLRDRLTKQAPIHYACSNGRIECANVLLNHDALYDLKDNLGDTILHKAVKSKSIKIVHWISEKIRILDRLKVNSRNRLGHTALMLCETSQMITVLLSIGCDPRLKNEHGIDAIYHAASIGNEPILRALLTTNFCCMDCKRHLPKDLENKESPLHIAVRNGHLSSVECLLDICPYYFQCNDPSTLQSPLHLAMILGNDAIVKRIVEFMRNLSKSCTENIGSFPSIESVLYGLDKWNMTPLMYGIAHGNVDAVMVLSNTIVNYYADSMIVMPNDHETIKKCLNIYAGRKESNFILTGDMTLQMFRCMSICIVSGLVTIDNEIVRLLFHSTSDLIGTIIDDLEMAITASNGNQYSIKFNAPSESRKKDDHISINNNVDNLNMYDTKIITSLRQNDPSMASISEDRVLQRFLYGHSYIFRQRSVYFEQLFQSQCGMSSSSNELKTDDLFVLDLSEYDHKIVQFYYHWIINMSDNPSTSHQLNYEQCLLQSFIDSDNDNINRKTFTLSNLINLMDLCEDVEDHSFQNLCEFQLILWAPAIHIHLNQDVQPDIIADNSFIDQSEQMMSYYQRRVKVVLQNLNIQLKQLTSQRIRKMIDKIRFFGESFMSHIHQNIITTSEECMDSIVTSMNRSKGFVSLQEKTSYYQELLETLYDSRIDWLNRLLDDDLLLIEFGICLYPISSIETTENCNNLEQPAIDHRRDNAEKYRQILIEIYQQFHRYSLISMTLLSDIISSSELQPKIEMDKFLSYQYYCDLVNRISKDLQSSSYNLKETIELSNNHQSTIQQLKRDRFWDDFKSFHRINIQLSCYDDDDGISIRMTQLCKQLIRNCNHHKYQIFENFFLQSSLILDKVTYHNVIVRVPSLNRDSASNRCDDRDGTIYYLHSHQICRSSPKFAGLIRFALLQHSSDRINQSRSDSDSRIKTRLEIVPDLPFISIDDQLNYELIEIRWRTAFYYMLQYIYSGFLPSYDLYYRQRQILATSACPQRDIYDQIFCAMNQSYDSDNIDLSYEYDQFLIDLYYLADDYVIDDLMIDLETHMCRNLNPRNCYEYYSFSKRFQLNTLTLLSASYGLTIAITYHRMSGNVSVRNEDLVDIVTDMLLDIHSDESF